jgi:hypothetical protein
MSDLALEGELAVQDGDERIHDKSGLFGFESML